MCYIISFVLKMVTCRINLVYVVCFKRQLQNLDCWQLNQIVNKSRKMKIVLKKLRVLLYTYESHFKRYASITNVDFILSLRLFNLICNFFPTGYWFIHSCLTGTFRLIHLSFSHIFVVIIPYNQVICGFAFYTAVRMLEFCVDIGWRFSVTSFYEFR